MKHQIFALPCVALLCSLPFADAFLVSAENTTDCYIIQVEKSKALYNEVKGDDGTITYKARPDSEITGEIDVIVYENPVLVTITCQTPEGILSYYQTEVTPQEGYTTTKYCFLVNYSECPDQDQLSEFDITYSADYLENTYASAYTVTIATLDGKDTTYTEENVLIADPKTESNLPDHTYFVYDVTTEEDAAQAVTVEADAADFSTAGSVTLNRRVQLQWVPYTLGDIDNNGAIDASDALQILTYYSTLFAGGTLSENANTMAADVDKSGDISVQDAYLTLKYYSATFAGESLSFDDFLANELA